MYFLWWCHQESNRGHKDFQSFALPTELWHHCFSFAVTKVGIFFEPAKFSQIFCKKLLRLKYLLYLCTRKTKAECSAVGSALRSGRRGRAFESPHSDFKQVKPLNISGFIIFKVLYRDKYETSKSLKPHTNSSLPNGKSLIFSQNPICNIAQISFTAALLS